MTSSRNNFLTVLFPAEKLNSVFFLSFSSTFLFSMSKKTIKTLMYSHIRYCLEEEIEVFSLLWGVTLLNALVKSSYLKRIAEICCQEQQGTTSKSFWAFFLKWYRFASVKDNAAHKIFWNCFQNRNTITHAGCHTSSQISKIGRISFDILAACTPIKRIEPYYTGSDINGMFTILCLQKHWAPAADVVAVV